MAGKSLAYKSNKQRGQEIQSWGDTLRKRLASGSAVEYINGVIDGSVKEPSITRLKAASIALNKCLPDLKAVAVAVHDSRPTTKADVDALLLESGLNPELVYKSSDTQVIEGKASVESESVHNKNE